jgi:hypothetical protein
MRQVDCDVLPLRVALEHPFERELATDAAFFVTAVGMVGALPEALVDLDPAGLDRVRRAEGPTDVMRPHIGGEAVVAGVRHADDVRFVGPGNGNEHRTEDLLARQAPVVRHIREDGGNRVIAFAERSLFGRKAAYHEVRLAPFQSLLDIATYLVELLLVDDGADVTRLIERIAELERFNLLPESIEEIVEDVAVEEETGDGSAG